MSAVIKVSIVSFLIIFSVNVKATIINVLDYGVKPNSYENAAPAIAKVLQSIKGDDDVVVQFPKGRIDIWPDGAVKRELYISNTTEDDTLSKVKNIALNLSDL